MSRFHMLFKTFLHSNTLRNDITSFQYSFLYFSSLLIAFLNYHVLVPPFPPTLQLRIITVRENGIYKKLLLILIHDTLFLQVHAFHSYFIELSLWTSYNGYYFPSLLGLWGDKRSPKSGRWFPFNRTDYADFLGVYKYLYYSKIVSSLWFSSLSKVLSWKNISIFPFSSKLEN